MADNGYTRKVAGYVGNLPNGAIVTVDEVREKLLPDALPAAAPSILSVLSHQTDPMIVRERNGVYRVVRGRRGPGRPPGTRTQYATPDPDQPVVGPTVEGAPVPEPRRRPRRHTPPPVVAPEFDHPDMLLVTFLRGLTDGSALYLDDANNVYKVAKLA